MGVRTTCLDPSDNPLPYLPCVTLGVRFKGRGVITCDRPYECFTHFVGGRTLPCMEPVCAACSADRPKRYEGFVSVVWVTNRKHEIVRFSWNAMMQLKSQISNQDSLRGLLVQLERKTGRQNGRVQCLVEPISIEVAKLPQTPKLEEHLARIWRVDGISVSTDERAYVAQLSAFIEDTIEGGKRDHA